MNLHHLIEEIGRGKKLSIADAKRLMQAIIEGEINDSQIVAVLFGLQIKGIAAEELLGFSQVLMERCQPIALPTRAIDLCGTGGDHKNTFNISTLTSLLLASMGYPVIKHGNYGSTSLTGSSQIMELAGYTFLDDEQALRTQFETFGYVYLHAPFFHKSLAKVSPLRKQLQMRTIFNLLGPLCNPARPTYRMHGTSSIAILNLYHHYFNTQSYQFAVYHTLDGYDEISLTAPFLYFTKNKKTMMHPELIGIPFVEGERIKNASTPEGALQLFLRIIEGKGEPEHHQIIAYNAAMAIVLFEQKAEDAIPLHYERCIEHIQKGTIKSYLDRIIRFQHS